MLVLNDPSQTWRIGDLVLRALVERRYVDILGGEVYDYDRHGYTVVVEPGDSVKEIEGEVCVPIMSNYMDENTTFGHPDFSPCFEWLIERPTSFEGTLVLTDDGFGISLFIPKVEGVDPELLAMCAQFAEPAPELTQQ